MAGLVEEERPANHGGGVGEGYAAFAGELNGNRGPTYASARGFV